MKKFLTSAGLVAASISGLHAAYAPTLSSMESSKPWSISAALRGFYDDNYTAVPRNSNRESYGYEVNPSVSLNLPLDQTFIGLSYDYSFRYYEDRSNHKYDQTHKFDARLDHAFSERYKIAVSDSFVVSKEPDVLSPSGSAATPSPLRTDEDAIRNFGTILFSAQLTELFGLEFGYDNTFYDYEQDEGDVAPGAQSRSGLLDRIEHLIKLNLRWQMRSDTVGILGYQFGMIDFTGNETIETFAGKNISSDARNARSHYLYIGADHRFNSQLNASLRIGGQYSDNYNQNTDSLTPYADASLTYQYNQSSYVQAGISHTLARTDVATVDANGDITTQQEVTSAYASITHKITSKLTGSLMAQGQRGVFDEGKADGDVEYFVISGLNLAYHFNPHLLAETGYNFDWLDSEQPGRDYTRNRVYIGVRATY